MSGSGFLPVTPEEVRKRGWHEIDVLLVSGDAYVDHPAFGAALIGRLLEAEGFRVAVLAQPDWRSVDSFKIFGRPRLFAGITAGCLDSMLAHYSPTGNLRREDAYSPGGRAGLRPNRAAIVYANRIREAFSGVPILLGGIEASMRRLAHYDYWSNQVRRSILLDSRADWIAYGMAESQILEISRRLAGNQSAPEIRDVRGTVWVAAAAAELPDDHILLPPEEAVTADKDAFNQAFRMYSQNQDSRYARPLVQPSGSRFVVQLPPAPPLSTEELDRIYSLSFTRQSHPVYEKSGGIPGLAIVETSITSHRGCSGGCAFCTLAGHQGRIVQSRSADSIQEEAGRIAGMEDFRGTITDIGGPTANMYGSRCRRAEGVCQRNSCLYPAICQFLEFDGSRHLQVLGKALDVDRVKHVFVGTGIRHDLVLADPCRDYLPELCKRHVGGHLKVAPEHISGPVLACMRKPARNVFEEFRVRFKEASGKAGLELYLVPYFMSGHPACRMEDMEKLNAYLKSFGHFLEQVQDFTPLPMTLSGCIYWTGKDPLTGEEVYVPRGSEKTGQRVLLQPVVSRDREKADKRALRQAKSGKKPVGKFPQNRRPGPRRPVSSNRKRRGQTER